MFDTREFVKEQKKKKMNEMMGENSNSNSSNDTQLFGGGNPLFGGMNPFGMPQSNNETSGSFNVDDLVKRIDAKIAELEEEERKEKELEASKQQTVPVDDVQPGNNQINVEIPSSQQNVATPIINTNEGINLESLNNKPVEVETKDDDEHFFDDFFSDE